MSRILSITERNIKAINRRLNTVGKLFGTHSPEYEQITNKLGQYDIYTNKQGMLQLRNNAANRQNYRQLSAWSREIKKTPSSVLKRKAEKQAEEIRERQDREEYDNGSRFADLATYNNWYSQFDDLFDACYELALLDAETGVIDMYEVAERAQYLAINYGEYVQSWNHHYYNGAFDEYKTVESEYINREYNVDSDSGEMLINPDFFNEM